MDDASKYVRRLPSFEEMKQETQGDTYKYVNKLLKGKSCQDLENIEEITSLSKNLPYFEDSLRLVIIDSLQMESRVIQILLSENEHHLLRMLRCDWFFKDRPANFYKEQIFPYISVSLRCKIISKLSRCYKSEEEAEELFSFVLDRYDRKLAESLLPRCSPGFILKYFSKGSFPSKHETGPRTIYKITLRYPEVGVKILSLIIAAGKFNVHQHKRAIFHIALHHPNIFIHFLEEGHLKIDFLLVGKSITKKYGEKLKEMFFNSIEMADKLALPEEYFFKNLSFEDKVKFFAVIVQRKGLKLSFQNWKNSEYKLTLFLKLIPPNERLGFVEAVFKQVYSLNYKDWPKCWSGNVLELLPAKERHCFVETLEQMLEKDSPDISFSSQRPESLYYLYEFDIAFPKFKAVLNTASALLKRDDILNYMVQNCQLHGDLNGLQQLVEFVATRQRQDDPNILNNFVELIVFRFPVRFLTDRIWQSMYDLSYFCCVKTNEWHSFRRLLEKYILRKLLNGEDVDLYVKQTVDLCLVKTHYSQDFMSGTYWKDYPDHSRTFFFAACKEIIQWLESHPPEDHTRNILVGSIFVTHRELRKRQEMSLVEIPDWEKLAGKLTPEESIGLEWSLDVWKKLGPYENPDVLWHILKGNPQVVIKHTEEILLFLISGYAKRHRSLLNALKKTASFYRVADSVTRVLLNEFKNGKSASRRILALELYSHFCSLSEYSEAIRGYIPERENVDEKADPAEAEIQLAVPRFIKNIATRWKSLDLVRKFLVGDFRQSAMSSFYSCCHHSRVDVVLPYLREYLNGVPNRVSYKKDVIRLVAELSDRLERTEFCLKCWTENKHHSLRKPLFLYLSKAFLQTPTRASFEALQACILDCRNLEVLGSRPGIRDVPREFVSDYVCALWTFSGQLNPERRKRFRSSVLAAFDSENIAGLSRDFCEDVIRNNLFRPGGLPADHFALGYLTSDPNSVCRRLGMIVDLMKSSDADPSAVSGFLSNLRASSVNRPTSMEEVSATLLRMWGGYPLEALHEDRLMLVYHELYLRTVNKSEDLGHVSRQFGKELRKVLLGIDHLSDLMVLVVDSLAKSLCALKYSKKPLDEVAVVKELIGDPKDRRLAIVAVLVLSEDAVGLHRQEEAFDSSEIAKKKELGEVVGLLENYGDEVVGIYFRRKFGLRKPEQKKEPESEGG